MRAKFQFLVFSLSLALLSLSSLEAKEYSVDKSSKIAFIASKFLVVSVEGQFLEFSGNLSLDENNLITALNGEIIISSVDSKDKDRDKHLLEADFLDEPNFPKGNFIMQSYTPKEGLKGEVKGELSLHGVSKIVTFQSELDPSQDKVKLILTSEINIKDFNIQGSFMNGDKIKLDLQTFWNEK
ncbi:hypothetical protein DMB95_04680 [Campylobacter sp. MIT 12-8780]|uniref:YceI family protein n=1 Tax=Campylobacter sp. MIT 12-8780 TaxID=2202200 RepID=UPI00115EDEAD|nr:YceI family protein [Campylobacter sp. MIT 12-8780]TQR41644.1 hypothetical protein DMB95_04680 [Campylobacter sp. MIT 12-8780]